MFLVGFLFPLSAVFAGLSLFAVQFISLYVIYIYSIYIYIWEI